ncbi:MAG: RNA-binding domain-containing protein [Gallionella sp.]
MTEQELLAYLREHCPRENDGGEWKEFKHLKHAITGKAGEDLISYVSALANMEGGVLVMGVSNNLRVVGIQDFHDYTPENLRLRALVRCPNLDSEGFSVENFVTSDTRKTVWLVHIPKHKPRLPVYAHDKTWQRIDESLVEMRHERLEAILHELVDQTDWSAQIVESATLADIDPAALALAREKFAEKHRNAAFAADIADWDMRTFLDKAKITIDGKITRTALLLLGKPEASHFLPTLPQITWKLVGEEQAYEHFGLPFLLTTTQVLHRIRNISYKLFPQNQLLATEVSKYDTRVILEALHNCIAHQDYMLRSRILVTEKIDRLTFENAGRFFDGKPEDYFAGEQTPKRYRNPWLSQAMVNLNMIDTVGHGIYTMILAQRNRYFPLPDYSKSEQNKVVLEIFGHVIDENYTRLLLEQRDLPLTTVVLLDRVQKKQPITDDAATMLRKAGLVEGRKPNYFVAAHIAKATGSRSEYIRNRAFDDAHYKDMVLAYLKKYGSASKQDLEGLILDKLSDVLDEKQKANKLRNLLYAMSKRDKTIEKSDGKKKGRWVLAYDIQE